MARPNRCEIVGEDEVAVLHVFSRCVRSAFLCGVDPLTGASYDHRKQFIQDRLEAFAAVFAIDVMAYAIMSHHFHLVLRARSNIVAEWTDEEVARRWWALFPERRTKKQTPSEPRQRRQGAFRGQALCSVFSLRTVSISCAVFRQAADCL